MTTPLFNRAAVFTDIHFGKSNNSTLHNEDCLKFVEWFVEQGGLYDCDAAIFCGDWHHNRSTTNSQTLSYTLKALERLNMGFPNVYFLIGNHDLYYRNRRDVSSVAFARYLPNIHLINEPTTMGDVTFCSWLVGDDPQTVSSMRSKYCFGHLELGGFKLNNSLIMPDIEGSLSMKHLRGFEEVYSGHYHRRQMREDEGGTLVTYFGNTFPHDYSDVHEEDSRGMMILEWGEKPQYLAWPDAPTYRYYSLSSVLNDTERLLRRGMHCRVNVDIPISFEESNYIKEVLVPQWGLRELQLIPQLKEDITEGSAADLQFHSVDQMVEESVTTIVSNNIDKQLLLEIYRSL